MPIYEYYCSVCDGRFSHLARRFDEPPPPCPGCSSDQVQKLISRVHTGRSETERRADFGARSREVNREDPREIARFLQGAGDFAEEVAPSIEREAFQEIIARRAEGASDEDLQDVTDAIPLPGREEMMRLHEQVHHHNHEHGQGHHHCDHDHEHVEIQKSGKKRSPRRSKDLGWA
jgi:putative FmdB family regulatory protein